jgi:septum formation protein
MLATIIGKTHLVITGFTVLDTARGKVVSKTVETAVTIKMLSPEEINAYVAMGEPLGKAGGYAIQGLGAVIVERVDGDFYNVIGLPLFALAETLKGFGVNILIGDGKILK